MSRHAEGTYTVISWDENTYQELDGSAKLTRATVAYHVVGDLTAEAAWDAVMYYRDDGTAVFTGFQRMVGTLDGRSGSFVMRADGSYGDGEAKSTWEVIDGSATGELAGLRGVGTAVATSTPPGTYSFDYEMG